MQADQARVPQETVPMRHVRAGREKRLEVLHCVPRGISLGHRERTQKTDQLGMIRALAVVVILNWADKHPPQP